MKTTKQKQETDRIFEQALGKRAPAAQRAWDEGRRMTKKDWEDDIDFFEQQERDKVIKSRKATGFSKWLFSYKADTWIRDLADDARKDEKWPVRSGLAIDFAEVYGLRFQSAAFSALVEAWGEYTNNGTSMFTVLENAKTFADDHYIGLDERIDISIPDDKRYVYALTENRQDYRLVRYVGITDNPISRYKQHVNAPTGIERIKWQGMLYARGEYPEMIILDIVDRELAREYEDAYLWAFEFLRHNMLNSVAVKRRKKRGIWPV